MINLNTDLSIDFSSRVTKNIDGDYRNNNFENVEALYHVRESGLANANSGLGITATGLWGGATSNVPHTATAFTDATNGHYITNALAGNGDWIGIVNAVSSRAMNPRLRVSAGALGSTARMYSGFHSVGFNLTLDTVIANADSGVVVGARSTDTNYQVFNNDGGGNAMTVTDLGVAKSSSTLKHIEIIFSDSTPNCKVYLDGTLKATLTTRIPATGTSLFVQVNPAVASSATTITGYFGFVQLEHMTSTTANWATAVPVAG